MLRSATARSVDVFVPSTSHVRSRAEYISGPSFQHQHPTKANRAETLAGSLPEFGMWKSCRMMLLVGGFSRGSSISPALHSGAVPYSPQSPSLALKISLLIAAPISSLPHFCGIVVCTNMRIWVNWSKSRGHLVVKLLASHLSEPGSTSGGSHPYFARGNRAVPDDGAGKYVFSVILCFAHPRIPTKLYTHLTSPSTALRTPLTMIHEAVNADGSKLIRYFRCAKRDALTPDLRALRPGRYIFAIDQGGAVGRHLLGPAFWLLAPPTISTRHLLFYPQDLCPSPLQLDQSLLDALDGTTPIADLKVNKKRILYCEFVVWFLRYINLCVEVMSRRFAWTTYADALDRKHAMNRTQARYQIN
ncbi:hypothetical protein PR048_023476 [Dryococelus australis]|uniref:Uncharacterized protein n=1 Tax=Dryococelus australis TaxID=614101 RepID=A0ABQ9GU78_9NEOP|nr:hypothetical protein PR048_023476 [Dryococelus australis]